jgi:hypothetical protein
VPLLAATQALFPYVVVLADRTGAELMLVRPDGPDVRDEVHGATEHVSKNAPGGWSQRRYQQRAEHRWEATARGVADALTRLVDEHAPRLAVVSGDVRAVQLLREQVPDRVAQVTTELSGEYTDIEEALSHAEPVVAGRVRADTEEILAAHERETGQVDQATSGPAATLAALARAQVETLLLDPRAAAGIEAWFGPEPTDCAASAEQARGFGVAAPMPAPLADVAVRAALATEAAVRVLPAEVGPNAPSPTGSERCFAIGDRAVAQ